MNWLDIVLAIILIVAAVSGYRSGLISQAFGIAGLLLGIWLGYRFSARLAVWFNMGEGWAYLLGFVIILVAAIVVSWLAGVLVKKVFRLTGFGLLDNVGGLALGVVKVALVVSLLLNLFVKFNDQAEVVKPKVFTESLIYKPMKKMSDAVFPWILRHAPKVRNGGDASRGGSETRNI